MIVLIIVCMMWMLNESELHLQRIVGELTLSPPRYCVPYAHLIHLCPLPTPKVFSAPAGLSD